MWFCGSLQTIGTLNLRPFPEEFAHFNRARKQNEQHICGAHFLSWSPTSISKYSLYSFLTSPVGRGSYKNRLTVWSLQVVGGDRRAEGNWVGDSLPVSFFVLSSFFMSVLLLLWAHQFPGLGCGVSPFVSRSFFFSLSSSFLLSFLGVSACRHLCGGRGLKFNK